MARRGKISSIVPFHYWYLGLDKEDIPEKHKLVPISFKNEQIKEFEVLLFHRLMKRNYGDPSEAEWKAVKQLDGRIGGIGREWKYYVKTPSGGIIQIGTERLASSLALHHVLPEKVDEPGERLIKEGKKFVADLLTEADRLKGQILNAKREFEKGEGIQCYLLNNVYLYNYGSAELMLEYAEDCERVPREGYLKYDAYTDYDDPEKMAYITKFQLGIGMYYAASISYYFMALEGFVNLIYHTFLRHELRDRELNLEQRLDLEQKVHLMPTLCYGFKEECIDPKSEIFQNFKRLKKYRNQIFHSKIEDSLKYVCLVESGFLYTCHMEKNKEQLFPSHKLNLKKEHVLTIKNIVDDITEDILSKMQKQFRELVDKFILKQSEVPFWKDEMGKIRLGKLETKDDNSM